MLQYLPGFRRLLQLKVACQLTFFFASNGFPLRLSLLIFSPFSANVQTCAKYFKLTCRISSRTTSLYHSNSEISAANCKQVCVSPKWWRLFKVLESLPFSWSDGVLLLHVLTAEGIKSSDFSAVLFSWTGFVLFCGQAKDWALDLLLCIVSRCKTSLTEVYSNFPWLRLTHIPCMSWKVGFSLTSLISTAERE